MPRQARYYNRDSEDDDEFELQAFREDAVRAGDDGASGKQLAKMQVLIFPQHSANIISSTNLHHSKNDTE